MPRTTAASVPAEPPAGRPRSADATEAVRTAALALAYEGGVHFATVERIAERSGVAKTTIYRRWPNAAAIVMDAFLDEISPRIPYRRKETVEETFVAAVRQLVTALKGQRGRLLRHLLGAAQSDPQLQQAFWDNWIGPRRAQALEVIADAQAQGQLPGDIDADALVDSIFGAVYYRLMIPYAELSAAYADAMVKQVFEGVVRR
jgi:AcrR family transcriptional regulator